MILPTLHVCSSDAHLAKLVLELCAHLGGKLDATLLVSHPDTYDPEELAELAGGAFSEVLFFRYDDLGGDKKWPKPQNWAWQQTARNIHEQRDALSKFDGWLWWEADACPIRKGWLTALDNAHLKGKQLFSGVKCSLPGAASYMNGVGIYPLAIVDALSNSSALFTSDWAFDAAAGSTVMKSFTNLDGVMIHSRKVRGGSDGCRFDASDADSLLSRNPEAVFLHGHDESLPLVLIGRTPPPKQQRELIRREYPSFTEQTEWDSGLFTFPASLSPTVYYNCSIAERRGEKYLFTRRQVFTVGFNSVGSTNKNDLAIFRIRSNMTLDPEVIVPQTPNRYLYEQWEDPRAMVGTDGQCYVSFATWVHGERWPVRQSFCQLSSSMDRFDVIYEPTKPEKATRQEKNWLWFEHDGKWHYVYLTNPHVVIEMGNGKYDAGHRSASIELPWKAGEPRGGTPPVRIGDEYVSFFHSSTPHERYRRRYYMGAYTFSAKPPFTPLRMTREPLLVGSESDFNCLNSPMVIFPNGALLENDKWLVVFGVNDEGSGWIKIPNKDLEQRMERLT